jgi:MYXO-CTERM domain-containing protein
VRRTNSLAFSSRSSSRSFAVQASWADRLSASFVRASHTLIAVFVGMLSTSRAHAYCRTSTTSSPDHDGRVCTPPQDSDSGVPLFWGMPRITYSIQEDASQDVSLAETQNAVRAAFDAWMAVDCGDGPPRIELIETETVVCALHEYNKDRGNANIIFYRDQDWDDSPSKLAITTVTFHKDTGEIFDADMALNSTDFHFTTGETVVDADLLSVLTHETGHFLGLAHSNVAGATMNEGYSTGSTALRDLTEDDRAGICAIYPPTTPITADCDSTPRHGFSAVCAEDQPVPDKDAGPTAEDRCCCDDGYECVSGRCVEQEGCACSSARAPGGTKWAALCTAAVAAALVRRHRRVERPDPRWRGKAD